MFAEFPLDMLRSFDWKDIHKKFGRIIVQEPTDSDINEGFFKTCVWFQCEDGKIYVLAEI
jgi:hypothetical protein